VTGSMKSAFGTTTSCYIDGRDEGISDYFETWKGLKAVERYLMSSAETDLYEPKSSVR
jgi:hypothetical protein